jgi:hypothetical protein
MNPSEMGQTSPSLVGFAKRAAAGHLVYLSAALTNSKLGNFASQSGK